ncbi:protein with a bacterial immunoglobulin-like domain protein [Legionella nautarum]|uniref:Protein with a bacterial immunoglobulin-like domain protein n=1 Tax=Legionella nautarum TaxID=45070 RepID=A0A0W0WW55_9GAMM|nr:hypothetical protein [Legionella nautarum]KTD36552.1 protein with a bacterial immunoglobulin-like domain protein [Legionella nautarum]
MKKASFFWQGMVAVFLLIITAVVQASEVKFSIIPIIRAPSSLPANGVAFIQYFVINNTGITRELTTVPIRGVHPIVTGAPGGCKSPFLLTPGQACILTLKLVGPEMVVGINSGPEVCKTMGPGDIRPDPFLCSQPAPSDVIQVSLGPAIPVTITAVPTSVAFRIGNLGKLTLTNTSNIGFAQNINAQFLTNTGISVVASSCPVNIPPSTSCDIYFSSQVIDMTTMSIMGSNTNQLLIPISSLGIPIQITPSSVRLYVNGGTKSVIVTNLSSTATASNVTVTPPSGVNIAESNNCGTLPPLSSCTITFTAGGTLYPNGANFKVQGSNTTAAFVKVYVQQATISVSPSTLTMTTNSSGTLTITNTSQFSLPALGVTAASFPNYITIPPGGNTCPASLAPGASCTITFNSNSTTSQLGASIFIRGTNTNTVLVPLSISEVILSLSPTTLNFEVGGPGATTTVTNNSTTATAQNIQPNPTTLYNSGVGTCGAAPFSLGAGLSCTMGFDAAASPGTENVVISGTNTNAPVLQINTTALPVLSVSPTVATITAGGIINTQFTITNVAVTGAQNATNVRIRYPNSWLTVQQVIDVNCNSLAPGQSCLIDLRSVDPYVGQGGIVVSGDNTSTTSPTVAIAFLYNDGLVFDTNGGVSVANLVDQSTNAAWQVLAANTTATSLTDGASNTQAMLTQSPLFASPAALACQNLGAGWFLPATAQLTAIQQLADLGFGNFTSTLYWSSTQADASTATWASFDPSVPVTGTDQKTVGLYVRCAITY